MKNLLYKAILLAMLATFWTGCSEEDIMLPVDVETVAESGSTINISMNFNIPDPLRVASRGIVTEAIENITILCFDKNREALAPITEISFESNENADEKEMPAGNITAKIPNATRIMHILANQSAQVYKGQTEEQVLNSLETTTSDKMVYWGRLVVPADKTSSADVKAWWAENKTVTLLRNMAKVEVSNNTNEFVLLGFTVVNTNASGYAVPYYSEGEDEVYPTDGTDFNLNKWIKTDYIYAAGTDLTSGTRDKMGTNGIYVYETPSTTSASIIIKGRNKTDAENVVKYWRVAFANEKAEQMNIRRNHCYIVNIEGELMYGDEDVYNESGELEIDGFTAAVNNPSVANSTWLSIAEEVTAVKNSKFSLTVENTSFVLANGTKSKKFIFNIEQLGTTPFNESELTVKWEAGDNDALDNSIGKGISFTINKSENENEPNLYKGTISLSLVELGNADRREGKVIISYGKNLQRSIKVIIIPQREFNVVSYNGVEGELDEETRTMVFNVEIDKNEYQFSQDEFAVDKLPIEILKFSLPSDYPIELLPFNVLISTNDFNVMGSSLVYEGDGGYGEKNDFGFKYVYPIKAIVDSGNKTIVYEVQLRYIKNLITDKAELTLEAENFKPLKLKVNYIYINDDAAN